MQLPPGLTVSGRVVLRPHTRTKKKTTRPSARSSTNLKTPRAQASDTEMPRTGAQSWTLATVRRTKMLDDQLCFSLRMRANEIRDRHRGRVQMLFDKLDLMHKDLLGEWMTLQEWDTCAA